MPCQILTFLVIGIISKEDGEVDGFPITSNTKFAVVRAFRNKPVAIRDSFQEGLHYSYLVQWGELREGFLLLDCNSIVAPVAVVPNLPIKLPSSGVKRRENVDSVDPIGGYFVVANCSDWVSFFSNAIIL